MAGIGFQLKRLFDREGLAGRIQAISYASFVTVGPMLSCMLAVTAIHWLLVQANAPFHPREIFQAGVSYAFAFSFIITSPFAMYVTRSVSDQLYEKRYDALLPSFYSCMQITLAVAFVPALLFALFTPLDLAEKIPLFVLYMELVVIWMEVVYVSAMKAYRKVAVAFAGGMGIAVLGIWILLNWSGQTVSASGLLWGMAGGFFVTACLLLSEIERFFRTEQPAFSFSFRKDARRYQSLLFIGLFTGLSMYEHQFAQWMWNGMWLEDTFRISPEYDVAVFYAVLSVLPSLIWFVISVETAFYPKFRQYYDFVIEGGTILDIDVARKEMEKVLIGEMAMLMGIQLVFSLIAIAAGIQFLPLIGFTSQMVDTFNILVMAFLVYVMTSIVLLLLLYFDDRKGAFALSALLLAANLVCSWLLRDVQYQGLSLFAASILTLVAALSRLVYRMRSLHYATFSAQPLSSSEPNVPERADK